MISLTLARLATLDERYQEAWSFYRQIGRGLPQAREASREAAYVLRHRKAWRRCAQLLTTLIPDETEGLALYELLLWQAVQVRSIDK